MLEQTTLQCYCLHLIKHIWDIIGELFLFFENEEGSRSLFDQLEDFRIEPSPTEDREVWNVKSKSVAMVKNCIYPLKPIFILSCFPEYG